MGNHVLAFVLAAAAIGGGCIGGDSQPQLHITDIEVTNEVDTLAGALDMEVHLFDATTHEHLGCSGRDEGMEPVDVSDVAYGIDAYFIRASDGFRMTDSDLIGHALEVQVIEDDAEPCPVAPGVDDDVVGISPIDLGAIDLGQTLAFDSVVALRIANE